MVKISDLKNREIINIVDGRRLGFIKDIDIDMDKGKISALILPGTSRFLGFWGREEQMVVPWEKIRKIGFDIVLIEINTMLDNDPNMY